MHGFATSSPKCGRLASGGVTLLDSTGRAVSSRILLSAGIACDDAVDRINGRLSKRCFPRSPWTTPGDSDVHFHTNNRKPLSPGGWIHIFRVPPNVVKEFSTCRELAADERNYDRALALAEYGEMKASVESASAFARSLLRSSTEPLTCAGIAVQRGGCQTTTRDQYGEHIGLHIDSWDNATISKRAYSPSRLCINIGCAERSLLYVNATVSSMSQALSTSGIETTASVSHANEIVSDFLQRFHFVPVIRVRVSPGEAYIAPTENVVHDGSTCDVSGLDITLTFRGAFDYREFQGSGSSTRTCPGCFAH